MKFFKTSFSVLLICLCMSSCISLQNPSGDTPKNLITKGRADTLHQTYLSNQYTFINNDLPGNAVDNVGALVKDLEDLKLFLESIIALKKRDSIGDVGMFVYFGADSTAAGISKSTLFFEAAYVAPSNKTKSIGSSFAPSGGATIQTGDSFIPVGGDNSYYDKLHPVGTRKGN